VIRQAAGVNALYLLQVATSFAVVVYISFLYGASKQVDVYFFALGIVAFHQTIFANIISIRGILLWKSDQKNKYKQFIQNIAAFTLIEVLVCLVLLYFWGERLARANDYTPLDINYSVGLVVASLPIVSAMAIISSAWDAQLQFHKSYVYTVAQNILFMAVLTALLKSNIDAGIVLSIGFLLSLIAVFLLVIASERTVLHQLYARMRARSLSPSHAEPWDNFSVYFVLGTAGMASIPLLERILALGLGEGAVSSLNYAYRIANFLGFGISAGISTVVLPLSIDALRTKNAETIRTFFRRLFRTLLILGLIVAVCIVAITLSGEVLVRAVYFRGHFDTVALEQTKLALLGYIGVLLNLAFNTIIVKVLFSLGSYKYTMILYVIAPIMYFTYAVEYADQSIFGLAMSMSLVLGVLLALNAGRLFAARRMLDV